MRPKKYKTEGGYRPKPNFHRNRILSISTLNTPDSTASYAKSNFTLYSSNTHKRVQELKKCEPTRSTSELLVKDFKTGSNSTGKSTDRTFYINRPSTSIWKANELLPSNSTKTTLTPRKYRQQSSSSTINLHLPKDKLKQSEPTVLTKPPVVIKSKVTSIRTRSATSQPIPSGTPLITKLKPKSERSRLNTRKFVNVNQ